MDAHILGSKVQPLNYQVGGSLGDYSTPSLSTSHSPPKQLDFDTSQEGVTALNDQPWVACAVHGQPNFGCDVYLHRNIQEADEAEGDQVTHETTATLTTSQSCTGLSGTCHLRS